MTKNGIDTKVADYIWNKNRLVLEKEQLKQGISKIIKKDDPNSVEPTKKIDKKSPAYNQMNAILQQRKDDGGAKRDKPTAAAGNGIVSGNSKAN